MREKIARALYDRDTAFKLDVLQKMDAVPLQIERAKARNWDAALPIERDRMFTFADAALETLMQPTEKMLEAWDGEIDCGPALPTFQAMIQAAKDGK